MELLGSRSALRTSCPWDPPFWRKSQGKLAHQGLIINSDNPEEFGLAKCGSPELHRELVILSENSLHSALAGKFE